MDEQAAGAVTDGAASDGDVAEAVRGGGSRTGAAAKPQRSLWKELPFLVVIALVLAVVIKTFFVQAFVIPSVSMENTLVKNDRVLVDKFSPWFGAEPQRGQVIVFKDPGGWLTGAEAPHPSSNAVLRDTQSVLSAIGLMPSADDGDLIKRVIAVGGDTVVCKAGAPLSVNGVALKEPYLYPGATPCDQAPVGTVTVPKGYLWVMGDNRGDSEDSRYHYQGPGSTAGFVPLSDVVGRAFVVAWPVSHWASLPSPADFHQPGLQQGDEVAAPVALGGLVVLVGAGLVLLRVRRRRSPRG